MLLRLLVAVPAAVEAAAVAGVATVRGVPAVLPWKEAALRAARVTALVRLRRPLPWAGWLSLKAPRL